MAQEHYSFLDNLEREEVEKYHFGMWDYQYERVSINLIAVWGDDVVDNLPFPTDDEKYLTLDLTRKLGRRESSLPPEFPSRAFADQDMQMRS